MSFRKANSISKRESFERSRSNLFNRIFSRKSPYDSFKKHKSSLSFTVKASCNGKKSDELSFLTDLELDLSYTSSIFRQKFNDHNRSNLIEQIFKCAQSIGVSLLGCEGFVDRLSDESDNSISMRKQLNVTNNRYENFFLWVQSLQDHNLCDCKIGQSLFVLLNIDAQILIERMRRDSTSGRKRGSLDEKALYTIDKVFDGQRGTRFNDEDLKLLDRLRKLDQDIEFVPRKPAPPSLDNSEMESYLRQVEEQANFFKDPQYSYLPDTEVNTVKVVDNCIMATSFISNDIPPVDGEIIDSSTDCTPTPQLPNQFTNGFNFCREEIDTNIVQQKPQRSKDIPLPPVPIENKQKTKCLLLNSTFPSEERSYRKMLLCSPADKSTVSNVPIKNFNYRSPLRSPGLINSINIQNNLSPISPSSTFSDKCLETSNPGKSPDLFSITDDGVSIHSLDNSRQLLMAKQIPNVIANPDHFLNLRDMKDDIALMAKSLDMDNSENKRFSSVSSKTTASLPTEVQDSSDNQAECNTEVKSDTEEYFEYFEIDGKKYRRKIKKRTVIEKIKIRKTVLAPMKPDGSGPDLSNVSIDDSANLDGLVSQKEETKCPEIDQNNRLEEIPQIPQKVFLRSHDERFRISKSMFFPYKDQMKRITLNNPISYQSDSGNKMFPLLSNYMYRFGQSDFEEPVIDKHLSTQLSNDPNAAWIQMSESNLPHERSKSICYFKKYRQKNLDGNTVHSSVRVTALRTVRMKPSNDEDNLSPNSLAVCVPAISVSGDFDESIRDEESDISTTESEFMSSGQFDSLLQSDEDNDDDSPSSHDSLSKEQDVASSSTSTMEDSDLQEIAESDNYQNESQRSSSLDSCFFSDRQSSFLYEPKDRGVSFIIKETNATPYLIFDDEARYGECDVAGGLVDALIVYACDGKEHLLFLGAFLDTYRTFIEPEDLINRLIIRFNHFHSKYMENKVSKRQEQAQKQTDDLNRSSNGVKMRRRESYDDDPDKKCKHVLSLLLTTIGKLKRDLTNRISEQIQSFQTHLQKIGEIQWDQAISKAIESQQTCLNKDNELVEHLQKISNQPLDQLDQKSPLKETSSPIRIPSLSFSQKVSIFSFQSKEIAEQITLLDWSKYRDVELMEILNLKDILNCKLPGVIEYANHFQNVQFWTQSILLDPQKKSMADRDRCCLKFLRIMKHLKDLNNFSSYIAMLLGIQLLPSKKLFSKRIRAKIKEMDYYMRPPRFAGYKEDLKEALAPCIPFLGIFYQDIVMLNIANPPYLDVEELAKISRNSNFSSNSTQSLSTLTEQCGPIINFWRSFKQYLFLKNCNKDQDKIRYSIKPNDKILQFLNGFRDNFDEPTIQRLTKQL